MKSATTSLEKDRKDIIKCLDDNADDDESLISALQVLMEERGEETYKILFHILTNLDLEPKQAKKSWQQIVEHWQNLCAILNRRINIRTALCDYFCSINKSLHNPKVIEIHLFEKTEERSKYDKLTKLFNRHYFDDILEREFARALRHNTDLSLLFLDLDDFKLINDQNGHQVGDEVLKKTAQIIMEEKRIEDIATRYGGEELAVIMPETDKINGMVLGERIRQKIFDNQFLIDGKKIKVTVSGGVSYYPQDAANQSELIKKADQALYHAKASGKNAVFPYSINRRQYMRIDFQEKIALRFLQENNTESIPVGGKNISVGGLLFESEKPLNLGSRVELTIPIKKTGPLFITGTVVRIESFGASSYDIGISFLETHEKAIDTITDYILNHFSISKDDPSGVGRGM